MLLCIIRIGKVSFNLCCLDYSINTYLRKKKKGPTTCLGT